MGLEVHRLAPEPQASSATKGRIRGFWGRFFFVVKLFSGSRSKVIFFFYKSCLLGSRSLSFVELCGLHCFKSLSLIVRMPYILKCREAAHI